VELEQNRAEFTRIGVNVAAVSYDSSAVLKHFADRKGIHYPLLSDPDSKIIRELGILNEDIPKNNPFYGVPHPVTFLIDEKGVITGKYFEQDMKERYTAADILVRRFSYTPEASKNQVRGKQLTAVASASNATARAGERVALILDIELQPNMHVYAPGVSGYIPIDWKLNNSDAWSDHGVTYPKPEILFLKVIDEKVPVFQNKLRLIREVTISQDAKVKPTLDAGGRLVIEGKLRYQACDDRVCYIPQELPLVWTLQYEAYDTERVPAELQRKAAK
jgi:hypothetical protein